MRDVTLITIMALTIIALIAVQTSMNDRLMRAKVEQYDQAVNMALVHTTHFFEDKEALLYVSETLGEGDADLQHHLDSLTNQMHYIAPLIRQNMNKGDESVDKVVDILHDNLSVNLEKTMYVLEKSAFRWIFDVEETNLKERLDFDEMGEVLKNHFAMYDIFDPFEFAVYDQHNRLVYSSPKVVAISRVRKPTFVYECPLFPMSVEGGQAKIQVVFPTIKSLRIDNMRSTIPTIILVVLVFVIFVYTIIIIKRQRGVNELKNDFINNMTHEFKTPLSAISLATEMLGDSDVEKTPQMIERLSTTIRSESKRLQILVDKVLQLASYEKGSTPIKLTDIYLHSLISDVCKSCEFNIAHVGGSLQLELDAQYDLVLADEVHFSNLMFNMIDNAVKYRSAERPLKIVIRTSSNQEGTIQITIEDNGIGISKEDQKHIFDKFFRVNTHNVHDVKGYGIGLTYVKRIIEAHYGQIRLTSQLNEGTQFILTLPTLMINDN